MKQFLITGPCNEADAKRVMKQAFGELMAINPSGMVFGQTSIRRYRVTARYTGLNSDYRVEMFDGVRMVATCTLNTTDLEE